MHSLNVHSHDVVCDDMYFGGVFRRCGSVQTDRVLMDLRGGLVLSGIVLTWKVINLLLE